MNLGSFMKKTVAVSLLITTSLHSLAFDIRCATGWSACIASQGTKIPSGVVVEMLGDCTKFTLRNAGAWSIKMSTAEITSEYERNGINSPIVQADTAFDRLRKSPLVFERDWERLSYPEIKSACTNLRRDFDDASRWVK